MSLQRSSVLSIGSRLTFGLGEEELHYDELSIEELQQTLKQTIRINQTLVLENDIFERYLMRHDPQCLQTMAQVLETAKHAQRVASQLVPISSVLSLTGSVAGLSMSRAEMTSPGISSTHTLIGSRRFIPISKEPAEKVTIYDTFRVSLIHRIEMTNKEIEEMKKSLMDLEQLAVKTKINLTAQMEEIELRIQETEQVRMELEENIVKRGVDPLTGKIPAERFVRFMEEWLKVADGTIEKLRLKGATMKSQIRKVKQQLNKRDELGETLSAIDFEQVAIENRDYVKKIEERNNYFLELKKITGRYSLKLTSQKQKLSEQVQTLRNIKKSIIQKQSQIEKLQDERKITRAEVEKANKQLTAIIRHMDEYTV